MIQKKSKYTKIVTKYVISFCFAGYNVHIIGVADKEVNDQNENIFGKCSYSENGRC